MSKNKGKFGKANVEIEQEDEFVSGVNRVLNRLKPHARRLIALGIGVLLVAIAAITYNWYLDKKDAAASELFAEAVGIYQEQVWSDPELLEMLPAESRPEVTYTSVKERADAALALLDKLQSEYGGSNVAIHATMFHAGVLYDAGRYGDAEEMYRAFAGSDEPELQRVIAREGIGYSIEARALAQTDKAARKSGLEAALEAFRVVQKSEQGPHRDYALYHQARVLQSLDRKDEAIALYKQILDAIPGTPLRRDINNRLALVE